MGTGSFGGGGGGGAGAIRSTGGEYRSVGGRLVGGAPARDTVARRVRDIFKRLPREYLHTFFASPLMQAAYAELFRLNVELRQNHRWDNIERRFGVDGGPGCLPRLVQAIITQSATRQEDDKVRETAAICLEDFLLRAVGNDSRVFMRGDAAAVLRQVDGVVFDRTSNTFLALLFTHVLERERERLPADAEAQLADIAQEMADGVVERYIEQRRAAGNVRFSELLSSLALGPEWFWKEVRR